MTAIDFGSGMQQDTKFSQLFSDVREHVLYLQELGVDSLNVDLAEFALVIPPPANVARPRPRGLETSAKTVPNAGRGAGNREKAGRRSAETASRFAAQSAAFASRTADPGVLKKSSSIPVPSLVSQSGMSELPQAKEAAAGTAGIGAAAGMPDSNETIEDIRHEIGDCSLPAHEGRTKIVHTAGNIEADLMFVGEAPGRRQGRQGSRSSGGQASCSPDNRGDRIKREEVVIGNINRCRPPGNRQPTLPEAHTCRPYLMREIAVIKPKVIVVLGNTAMHNLLEHKGRHFENAGTVSTTIST